MKFYIAGPMRGLPEYNFPAFRKAAKTLREHGHEVWSPAEHDEANGFDPTSDEARSLAEYMEHDLAEVCRADALVLLDGWWRSVGACLELVVAVVCEKDVYALLPGGALSPLDAPSMLGFAFGFLSGKGKS